MTQRVEAAQDPEELFDVIRANGTPTGLIKPRWQIHRDGDWHRAIHVWVAGIDEAGAPFLMVQRRSSLKDTWPDHYDATVGGHYRAGETLVETLREIEEEIGLPPQGLALRPLGVRMCANEAQPGITDREVQDIFLLLDNRPLEAFRPNADELAALVRFPLDALLPFLAGETADAPGVSMAPGETRIVPVTSCIDDFIPTVDRYFLRVAIAVQNVMRGDRYVAI